AEKNVILLNEEIRKKTKNKIIVYISLNEKLYDDENMRETFEALEKKSSKQLELLMHFLNLTMDEKTDKMIARTKLLKVANSTSAVLNQLIKKEVFTVVEMPEYQISNKDFITTDKNVLNPDQQLAYESINQQFEKHDVVLLRGVTSSGKTEVYIHLIEQCIQQGKQVLYLLPEIALTTQMIRRLQKHFGEHLLVYHSRFNDSERLSTWNKLVHFAEQSELDRKNYQIIIGARSAVFLPFTNLGLVIVDEEHENSFKQFDPAPRYHARDVAIVAATFFKAKVLLGSATPALETFYNAQTGKYGLATLEKRFADMLMPEVEVVDIKEAYRRNKMKTHFSVTLLDAIAEALKLNEQIILFQNRRGFATLLECKNCSWVPHCINCDVTLTYHKSSNNLVCHYCGYKTVIPVKCKACGNTDIRMKGIGTERIEDDLEIFFPDKKISRLDVDTARSKHAYQQIISDFENGVVDILVGTQMVTKGLDFDNVSTVGIINADGLFNYPDFRSSERSFQLMSQVAGRSGRKKKQGKVYLQTYTPTHPVIQHVVNHDYLKFYEHELNERLKFSYPPYFRLIEIHLKCKDEILLMDASEKFVNLLRIKFGKRILGPVTPNVSRINLYYIRSVLMKVEKEASIREAKKMMLKVFEGFYQTEEFQRVNIVLDVDPM
ncbi:MAG: primosomal protein N', partial [Bacteroidia bacterium]